ncbi:MAG: DUF4440 domain-containing protein [Pseudonocardiaceae bacterium]
MTGYILEQSIKDLHDIIKNWVSGKVEKTTTELSRFAELLTPDFTIISPSGTLANLDTILREIEDAYAKLPGLVIEIENFNLIATNANLAVASYEEFQQWPGGANRRHSTALFVSQTNSERDYLWRHIHETWLETATTEES